LSQECRLARVSTSLSDYGDLRPIRWDLGTRTRLVPDDQLDNAVLVPYARPRCGHTAWASMRADARSTVNHRSWAVVLWWGVAKNAMCKSARLQIRLWRPASSETRRRLRARCWRTGSLGASLLLVGLALLAFRLVPGWPKRARPPARWTEYTAAKSFRWMRSRPTAAFRRVVSSRGTRRRPPAPLADGRRPNRSR
jgi:hypothetical protein